MPHTYRAHLEWTNDKPNAPYTYSSYSRSHILSSSEGMHPIEASASPVYRGVAERWNPEDLMVAALSSCQLLTYLAIAARSGVKVRSYTDDASGVLEGPPGREWLTRVTLRPRITITDPAHSERALAIIQEAHEGCFIANSVKTEIVNEPEIIVET